MAKLSLMVIAVCLISFTVTIHQSSSARTLGNPTPAQSNDLHKISFLMRDVLNVTTPSTKPATSKVTSQFPFSKPIGLFPPLAGIPTPETYSAIPVSGYSTQPLDLSAIGLSFPARATVQELESGIVTAIDEYLFIVEDQALQVTGTAQGIYVASSEDGSSHMIAMTAYFARSEFKDGLRFFGVHQTDVKESHITVIGGTGQYQDANGYASLKKVNLESIPTGEENDSDNLLLFHVYLSQ